MDDCCLAAYIRELIDQDKLYKFYKSKEWIELRDEVLKDNHYECWHCLQNGKYTRATMVHHINEVRKRPDMALTKEYKDAISGMMVKNLVPLCHACHEAEHDRFENIRAEQGKEKFTNREQW